MRDRLAPALGIGAAAAILPVAGMHYLGREEVHIAGTIHFAAVVTGALVATGAAIALTVVGARRDDGRVVLVGTAFSVMAALLLVHGIATPGLLVGSNGLVALTGGATLPVGGAVLALSALGLLARPGGVRPLLRLHVALLAAIGLACGLGMAFPGLVPGVPQPASTAALILLGAGLLFYVALGIRAFRTFLLTRRGGDLGVVVGIVWLAGALTAALTLDYWDLGWWLGHGFEVAGIALVGGVVAYNLYRAAQSRPLIGDFRAAELVAEEEAFLGSHIRTLMIRLAEKDEYTEQHTRRVALRAVEVGATLGLSPGRLRALAAAGLLHDIGKLSIPDAILKKPTALNTDEYEAIKRHPELGAALLRELGGFSPAVVELVRSHHERPDGSGYPQGLAEDELDLETRILGVCDVYDALRSSRVYREAWTHEQALDHLREAAGRELDARSVRALERVLRDEPVAKTAVAAPTGRPQALPVPAR